MEPTSSGVYIDSVLTNMSIAYLQQESSFIARRVFPTVQVERQSAIYYKFDRNDFSRDQMERRPPATESAGGGYSLTTDTYHADVWALHKDIDDQTRANTSNVLNPDRNATQWLTQMALIRMEKSWVDSFFTGGVWTGGDWDGVAGVPAANQFRQWDDYTNSDPVADIEAARELILSTGHMPNTLVLGYAVYAALKNHPDIIDRIKYTTNDVVGADLLARLFEVDRVLVATAVAATNAEGAADAYGFIQGKAALLTYSAPAPALEMASAGYTIEWTGVSDGLGASTGIVRIPMPMLRAERLEIQMAFDQKIVAPDLGVFFDTAVS